MKSFLAFFFFLASFWSSNQDLSSKFDNNRISSDPYISGDTFRAHADHVFDETNEVFDPTKVSKGQTVFVKTDFLGYFLEKHYSKISKPFILITHNSDAAVPGPYSGILGDSKLIAWFSQNVEGAPHPKLLPIPIGIANQRWPHGSIKTFKKIGENEGGALKKNLVYLNFELGTHTDRPAAHQYFQNRPFCSMAAKRKFQDYLLDMSQSKFVLSPRGNGLDCHRTWETLLMGSYPIVKSSPSDSLYDGLPVVIVNDWEEVTEEFLQKKYIEFQKKSHNMEKIYIQYWLDLIRSYQEKYL